MMSLAKEKLRKLRTKGNQTGARAISQSFSKGTYEESYYSLQLYGPGIGNTTAAYVPATPTKYKHFNQNPKAWERQICILTRGGFESSP